MDDYTHYTTVCIQTYKSEVFNALKHYGRKSQAHFNVKIVNIYRDNDGEYLSNEMEEYCVKEGITYHLTVPHTPQLNSVSE